MADFVEGMKMLRADAMDGKSHYSHGMMREFTVAVQDDNVLGG